MDNNTGPIYIMLMPNYDNLSTIIIIMQGFAVSIASLGSLMGSLIGGCEFMGDGTSE